MLRSLPLWVSLFTLAGAVSQASEDRAFKYAGFFQWGSVETPAAQEVYERGYKNGTGGFLRSIVPFEQSLNGTNSNWTFEVVANNYIVPDTPSQLGQPNVSKVRFLQQYNTQWHLKFPSADNQTLNELLQYDTRLDLLHIPAPAILTSNFSGDSGNCTPIIGASCVEAMRYEAQTATSFRWNQSRLASSGCSSTLAQQLVDNQLNLEIQSLKQSQINTTRNAVTITSGDPLIYWDSDVYTSAFSDDAGDALHLTGGALHILIVTPQHTASNPEAQLPPQSAVCAVLEPRFDGAAVSLRAMSTFLAMIVSVGATVAIMW